MRRRGGDTAGFTLIEILVVVAIFAVLSSLAYGGLNAVLEQRQRTGLLMERLHEIQYAFRVISLDLYQINPRSIRDEIGDGRYPAFVADERSEYLLEFTRAGWSNPRGTPRSTLQRVAYRFEEDKLVRQYWQVLDRTLANTPVEGELIEGVEEITLRFMDYSREWHETWPPSRNSAGGDFRPLAIEVTLVLEDWGSHYPARRGDRMKNRQRQLGVALITAVLIMTLATIAATQLVAENGLSIRRTSNLLAMDQAMLYSLGAESWVIEILKQDGRESDIDYLGEIWATPLPPLEVEGGVIPGVH